MLQALQTLFFVGCLFHDAMKLLNGTNWLNLGSKFQTLLSLFFSSIILPTGIVSIIFFRYIKIVWLHCPYYLIGFFKVIDYNWITI